MTEARKDDEHVLATKTALNRLLAASLATAAALPHSRPSMAAEDSDARGDTERLDIVGTIPPECSFTESPPNTNIGTLTQNAEVSVGTLGFTCNLAALSNVTLTVRSSHGALKRDDGTETVAYAAWWKVSSFNGFTPVSAWTPSAFTFTEQSAANGTQKSAELRVRITGPTANLTAGDYKDTLTFTVAP